MDIHPLARGQSAVDLVHNIHSLGSLPEVYLRVSEALASPEWDGARISRIIAGDADLTARLLRLANSPYYGYDGGITTVQRAVTVIGGSHLRALVLVSCTVNLAAEVDPSLIDRRAFWRHSVYCGVVARVLGELGTCRVLHLEPLFVAGLLHDIGELVFARRLPEVARSLMGLTADLRRAREHALLGFDHTDVGSALGGLWQLPASLIEPLACHHAPGRATRYAMDTALLHVADLVAQAAEDGEPLEDALGRAHPGALALTGLDVAAAELAVERAGPLFAQALDMLLPDMH